MFKKIVLLSAITVHALSWSGMETRRLDACKAISFLSNLTSLFQPKAFNVSASASNLNKVFSQSTRVVTQLGSATPPTSVKLGAYVIGEFAQGGVVIWVTEDKLHGLVVSIDNLGSTTGPNAYTLSWGPTDTTTGATANNPLPNNYINPVPNENYSGYLNQKKIENLNPTFDNYPAFKAAADYAKILNGRHYDDWFLPSLNELQQIYENRDVVSKVSVKNGGDALFTQETDPAGGCYWSSVEGNDDYASFLSFYYNVQDYLLKSDLFVVRCVRAF